jgi:hypothetical protein
MAQPVPIFTSPSTTVVQVDGLQNPYTPVILNTVSYAGQVLTVLNTLSTLDILSKPIVVSTITGTSFNDTTFSTLIQQPQGYITAQTLGNNQWAYLNSYPFRDQLVSAGTQVLTASLLITAQTSTIQDFASSLVVENLRVSGNFSQSSGLILNTSVSSLGTVVIVSSLTVNGSTFFQSSVSSLGQIVFQSSLTVDGSFFSRSSIVCENTLLISTSLFTLNDINIAQPSRAVRIDEGLRVSRLEVQTSTASAMDVGDSFYSQGSIHTGDSVLVGGYMSLESLSVSGNVSTLSSLNTFNRIEVASRSFFQSSLSVAGKLGLGTSLSVDGPLFVKSTLTLDRNLTIQHNFVSFSTLSTNYLFAESAYISGNLAVFSTPFVSAQNLAVGGSLGFGDLIALSTSVGGNVSTFSNLVLQNTTTIDGNFLTVGTISTLSSFSVQQDFCVISSISIGTSLFLSGGVQVYGNARIQDTFSTNVNSPNFFSTLVEGDLSIEGSLTVQNLAFLSSIVLPSSVLAFNFITETFATGHRGIASSIQISTLLTSSITTGGLLQAEQTMDMANVFLTPNLSTFLLSTLSLQLGSTEQPSTFIHVVSSFGIQKQADENTFDVNTVLYTLNDTYVSQYLSTLEVFATQAEGFFFGDGFLLNDVNYPARLSSLSLSTSQIQVGKTFLSSFLASSGTVTDTFVPYSTLRIGEFYIFGNAREDVALTSNVLQTVSHSSMVALNNMYIFGDSQSILPKQVIINSNFFPSLSNTINLAVGGVLALNKITSPGFSLFIQEYTGDILVGVNVGSLYTNTVYIESGIFGKNTGVFFLPDGYNAVRLSTNIIQPVLSTMVFNSTLIVDRGLQKVGINTKPFYTLDVYNESYVEHSALSIYSTSIAGQLNVNQQQSNFWLAVTSNTTFSNILYSADKGETWTPFSPINRAEGGSLLTIATNGGSLNITQSNTLTSQKLWVAGGTVLPQYYIEGSPSWEYLSNTSRFPVGITSVAFNGDLWVLTGYNSSNLTPASSYPTLHWSTDGSNWGPSESGGFGYDGVSDTYGGRSVVWNGSLWVAVGQGASLANSILYSGDGKNWSDAVSGGFTTYGYGVAWSGSNWVATGNNGSELSSFCLSADGSNWTAVGGYGFNGFPNQRGNAVASDGKKIVAVGSYTSSDPTSKSIKYSLNGGTTWSNALGTLFDVDGYEGYSVVYNGEYWLAGGTNGVRKSVDGITWTQPVGAPTNVFQGMAFSSNAQPIFQIGASNYLSSITSTLTTLAVAVGTDVGVLMDSNCMRYSTDGINWSNSVSGFFTEQGRGVAYNGSNLWVAAGKGGVSNFVYSGNGSNWSNCLLYDPTGAFAIGTGVVYGGDYWVGTVDLNGGGGDSLFYSGNGSDWYAGNIGTQFTTAGYGVAYSAGQYIAVGEGTNTILTTSSSPPRNWSATGIVNAFSSKGRGIAYGNSKWVACGEDANASTIKYSGDGVNWSDATTGIFPTAGYGVAYNGSNLWVAAGDGSGSPARSNLLYSGDAISWSNANAGAFTTKAYGVAYNEGLKRWMAAGDGPLGVTLKYSGDGSNWSNATGAFDTYGYGIGTYSKTTSTTTTFLNQLRFYNTPGYDVPTRNSITNISYTSTTLTLMNTLSVDERKTVSFYSNTPPYVSSFYNPALAIVSSFVSTQTSQVFGYFLTTTLV